MDAKFAEQEEKLNAKMDARFAEQDKKWDAKFKEQDKKWEGRFAEQDKKAEERNKVVDSRFDKIENMLDMMVNVNLAKILNEQTKTRTELANTRIELKNDLNKYIKQNEYEHKKMECKLAEIEMKYGYTANQ